jgi:hypothetical protein
LKFEINKKHKKKITLAINKEQKYLKNNNTIIKQQMAGRNKTNKF